MPTTLTELIRASEVLQDEAADALHQIEMYTKNLADSAEQLHDRYVTASNETDRLLYGKLEDANRAHAAKLTGLLASYKRHLNQLRRALS